MTAHDCRTYQPDCYRCDLSRNEIAEPTERDPACCGNPFCGWCPGDHPAPHQGQGIARRIVRDVLNDHALRGDRHALAELNRRHPEDAFICARQLRTRREFYVRQVAALAAPPSFSLLNVSE